MFAPKILASIPELAEYYRTDLARLRVITRDASVVTELWIRSRHAPPTQEIFCIFILICQLLNIPKPEFKNSKLLWSYTYDRREILGTCTACAAGFVHGLLIARGKFCFREPLCPG
jgi:hypothetical protein